VILGRGVVVCLLLSAHRAVIFAIVQLSWFIKSVLTRISRTSALYISNMRACVCVCARVCVEVVEDQRIADGVELVSRRRGSTAAVRPIRRPLDDDDEEHLCQRPVHVRRLVHFQSSQRRRCATSRHILGPRPLSAVQKSKMADGRHFEQRQT